MNLQYLTSVVLLVYVSSLILRETITFQDLRTLELETKIQALQKKTEEKGGRLVAVCKDTCSLYAAYS